MICGAGAWYHSSNISTTMVDGRNVSAFAKLQNALMQQRAFRPHATASQKNKHRIAALLHRAECAPECSLHCSALCLALKFSPSSVVGRFCRAGFGAQNCQPALNLNRSTKLQVCTSPRLTKTRVIASASFGLHCDCRLLSVIKSPCTKPMIICTIINNIPKPSCPSPYSSCPVNNFE